MRPVHRGEVPTDDNGIDIEFNDYKKARDPLIHRIGDYCSYCEVALHDQVDVEHVLPKSVHEDLELEWSNFLLACGTCNSTKGSKDIALDDHYWPDQDNTSRVFFYELDQAPQIVDHADVDPIKAENTLLLTGIDRKPGHPNLSDRDRRWKKRFDTWGTALMVAGMLEDRDDVEMRTLAVELAAALGFWSVWMTVFSDNAEMLSLLIARFPGTAKDCFNDQFAFLPRPGGSV